MRRGFSLIELIFVIIVIGILAKFGTNLLMTSYEAYTTSTINNRLQADTELTLKQIANRLRYRIRDSVIARDLVTPQFSGLSSAAGPNFTVLEWVGYDVDGLLGTSRAGALAEPLFNRPTWSGFIDVDVPPAGSSFLESPETDTAAADTVIQALSVNGTDLNNSAIFFTGANSDVRTDYGWDGVAIADQSTATHPIGSGATPTRLRDTLGVSFSGVDVYENYQLAWTAYAIAIEGNDLAFYYDYQPWQGEGYLAGRRVLLLQNVETFSFGATGDTIQVRICVNEQNTLGKGAYAICKETAIF